MDRLRAGDPETIGPFRLVARLGAGGMGVVFLGTRETERVAIKVVRNSFLDDPSLRTRFEREIDTLQKISSPFVAQIVDSSTEGEFAWHAVEFVNGPTLRELVDSKGPLPEDHWWMVGRQLFDALHAVHQLGIVHRDIKPANIIMSDTGPKLIDFGISQDSDATSLTMTGLVAGSPAWLSPEQLEGNPLTAGSDLYSLGSVLVFAASGRSPWGDETSMSVPVVYQKILAGQVNLDGLTADQKNLVMSLQHPDPAKRGFPPDLVFMPPTPTDTRPPQPPERAAASMSVGAKQKGGPSLGVPRATSPKRHQEPRDSRSPAPSPGRTPANDPGGPVGAISAPQTPLRQRVVFASVVSVAVAVLITVIVWAMGESGSVPNSEVPLSADSESTDAPSDTAIFVPLMSSPVEGMQYVYSMWVRPGTGEILVRDGPLPSTLRTLDAATLKPTLMPQIGWVSSVSPSGDYVALSVKEEGGVPASLALLHLDSGQVENVFPAVCDYFCISTFSTTGDSFYFVQEGDVQFDAELEASAPPGDSISVINLDSGAAQELPFGDQNIHDIAVHGDLLIVSSGEGAFSAEDDTLTFFDLFLGIPVAEITTGNVSDTRLTLRNFVVDRQNEILYFTVMNAQSIAAGPSELWAVDLKSLQVLFTKNFVGFSSHFDYAVSPNGNYVALRPFSKDVVEIYDTASGKIVQTIPLANPSGLTFSEDGLLYVGGDTDLITVFQPSG